MPGNKQDIAEYAKQCSGGFNAEARMKLSSMMCWDAVVQCIIDAGYDLHQRFRPGLSQANLVALMKGSTRVKTIKEMKTLQPLILAPPSNNIHSSLRF